MSSNKLDIYARGSKGAIKVVTHLQSPLLFFDQYFWQTQYRQIHSTNPPIVDGESPDMYDVWLN